MSEIFRHGCVLKVTKEDTIDSIKHQFSLMKKCMMNTVVIWPATFWWEEKTPHYPFFTGKLILDAAEEIGLKVVMELAGQSTFFEYAPDFKMKDEYYAVDAKGDREYGQSSFGFLNYFHPKVKEMIHNHFSQAALAYKDHSALLAYDIFNETMFRSFDQYTGAEFRLWLEEKYGTIERLNDVWERTYSSFSQVSFENWKWMSVMPSVDYAAFRKAAIGRFLSGWKNAILEFDDKHIIMADNIHSQVSPNHSYERPQDDYGLKEICDEIGMSFYPKQNTGTLEYPLRWEIFDSFYSAAQRNGFWIAEMQTHIQALFNPNTCVSIDELKMWSLEGYAAGAKALIYWMWRPFSKGLQTLGRGIVNYQNQPTERYFVAKHLSQIFQEHGVLKPIKSKIGILYDPICDDFQRVFSSSYNLDKAIFI